MEQVGKYTRETGLNKKAMIKMVLQLGLNAGDSGFKRADALEVLEHSLPIGMTKNQKLDYVSNMLKSLQGEDLLTKTHSGKQWIITDKGKSEIE